MNIQMLLLLFALRLYLVLLYMHMYIYIYILFTCYAIHPLIINSSRYILINILLSQRRAATRERTLSSILFIYQSTWIKSVFTH